MSSIIEGSFEGYLAYDSNGSLAFRVNDGSENGFHTYEEALDAASRNAAKNERKYTIYKAVATVETETPPVKVTTLE